MQRNTTLLLVGALAAILAIGMIAPAVSAHATTDAPTTDDAHVQNATETQAEYMAGWMESRMGPDGVESFEAQTGTTVEDVAHALADTMGPASGSWSDSSDSSQYGPNARNGYQTPCGGAGPMMPGGHGYGPGAWGANSPDAGYDSGGAVGPRGYGPSGNTPGGYGPGMGGHGMGGGMGGGW